MVEINLTSDSILYGAGGIAIGFGLGYMLKKTLKLVFMGILAVAGALIVGLMYLQHIKVVSINQTNLENFVNNSIDKATDMIGFQCDSINTNISNLMNSECINGMINPFQNTLMTLGIPMSSGIGLGFVTGWIKG